jgi:hypothetical protein
VLSPPLLVRLELLPIRAREVSDVRRILDILASDTATMAAAQN